MRFLAAVVVLLFCGGVRAEPPLVAASLDALRAALSADTVCEYLDRNSAALLIPEAFAPPVFGVDPHYKNKTARVIYVYEKSETSDKMVRRVVVRFAPDDRENAVRIARLVAHLLRLHRQMFRRETAFPREASTANIWLVPSPNATTDIGGETRDANVYIFAVSAIKTPIELIRTVAHEWGHLTIPAARGYSEPEFDAAGYLGERLYLHAMTFPLRNTPPEPYSKDPAMLAALIRYNERQTLPLMKRFADGGAFSPVLRGDGTEAMDYYIGMILSCYETFFAADYTVSLIGAALWSVGGEKPADFVRSLEREMAKHTGLGVYISQLPAHVPLAKGEYSLESLGNGEDVLTFAGSGTRTVALRQVPGTEATKRRTGTVRITKPGWYRVTAAKGYTAFRLTRRKSNADATP